MSDFHYVYILQSVANERRYYVGLTKDLGDAKCAVEIQMDCFVVPRGGTPRNDKPE